MRSTYNSGNLANLRYEAEKSLRDHLLYLTTAEPSHETSKWREPQPDYHFEKQTDKLMVEEMKTNAQNQVIQNKLDGIACENRKDNTKEFTPGWRIGTGRGEGGTCIDCYKLNLYDSVKSSMEKTHIKTRVNLHEKRIKENQEIVHYLDQTKSNYERKPLEQEYEERKKKHDAMKEKAVSSTSLHLGLIPAAKKFTAHIPHSLPRHYCTMGEYRHRSPLSEQDDMEFTTTEETPFPTTKPTISQGIHEHSAFLDDQKQASAGPSKAKGSRPSTAPNKRTVSASSASSPHNNNISKLHNHSSLVATSKRIPIDFADKVKAHYRKAKESALPKSTQDELVALEEYLLIRNHTTTSSSPTPLAWNPHTLHTGVSGNGDLPKPKGVPIGAVQETEYINAQKRENIATNEEYLSDRCVNILQYQAYCVANNIPIPTVTPSSSSANNNGKNSNRPKSAAKSQQQRSNILNNPAMSFMTSPLSSTKEKNISNKTNTTESQQSSTRIRPQSAPSTATNNHHKHQQEDHSTMYTSELSSMIDTKQPFHNQNNSNTSPQMIITSSSSSSRHDHNNVTNGILLTTQTNSMKKLHSLRKNVSFSPAHPIPLHNTPPQQHRHRQHDENDNDNDNDNDNEHNNHKQSHNNHDHTHHTRDETTSHHHRQEKNPPQNWLKNNESMKTTNSESSKSSTSSSHHHTDPHSHHNQQHDPHYTHDHNHHNTTNNTHTHSHSHSHSPPKRRHQQHHHQELPHIREDDTIPSSSKSQLQSSSSSPSKPAQKWTIPDSSNQNNTTTCSISSTATDVTNLIGGGRDDGKVELGVFYPQHHNQIHHVPFMQDVPEVLRSSDKQLLAIEQHQQHQLAASYSSHSSHSSSSHSQKHHIQQHHHLHPHKHHLDRTNTAMVLHQVEEFVHAQILSNTFVAHSRQSMVPSHFPPSSASTASSMMREHHSGVGAMERDDHPHHHHSQLHDNESGSIDDHLIYHNHSSFYHPPHNDNDNDATNYRHSFHIADHRIPSHLRKHLYSFQDQVFSEEQLLLVYFHFVSRFQLSIRCDRLVREAGRQRIITVGSIVTSTTASPSSSSSSSSLLADEEKLVVENANTDVNAKEGHTEENKEERRHQLQEQEEEFHIILYDIGYYLPSTANHHHSVDNSGKHSKTRRNSSKVHEDAYLSTTCGILVVYYVVPTHNTENGRKSPQKQPKSPKSLLPQHSGFTEQEACWKYFTINELYDLYHHTTNEETEGHNDNDNKSEKYPTCAVRFIPSSLTSSIHVKDSETDNNHHHPAALKKQNTFHHQQQQQEVKEKKQMQNVDYSDIGKLFFEMKSFAYPHGHTTMDLSEEEMIMGGGNSSKKHMKQSADEKEKEKNEAMKKHNDEKEDRGDKNKTTTKHDQVTENSTQHRSSNTIPPSLSPPPSAKENNRHVTGSQNQWVIIDEDESHPIISPCILDMSDNEALHLLQDWLMEHLQVVRDVQPPHKLHLQLKK